MKTVEVKQLVKLWVTPALLRRWAEIMERKWPTLICGDSVIAHQFVVDDNVDIAICFDQNRMERELQNG